MKKNKSIWAMLRRSRGKLPQWNPKVGDRCFACYDGKYGRRVEGKVVKHQGGTLVVEFVPYCSDDNKPVKMRANRKFGHWAGWLVEDFNLMSALFGRKACPGDYYAVYRYKEEDNG